MNLFELLTLLCVSSGLYLGYLVGSTFGPIHGIVVGLFAAILGRYIGPMLGVLILLPFQGISHLLSFFTTGRWTNNKPPRPAKKHFTAPTPGP